MRTFGRSIMAILAGAAVVVVFMVVFERLSHRIYPLPPGVHPHHMDAGAMREFIAALPLGLFVIVIGGWALGTFAGAWVAGKLAARAPLAHGMILGLLVLAAGVMEMLAIPHPVGVWIAAIVLLPAGGYLGGLLAARGGARAAA